MKIQGLILLSALFVCACQISQKAQTNEFSNKVNANQTTVTNSPEIKQTKIEKPVDNSKFSSAEIRRTEHGKKISLKINVKYPQLKETKNSRETQFNQYVRKEVNKEIFDFRKFLEEKNKDVKSNSKDEYEINLDYNIEYISDKFISILMNWSGFSGYLNEDYFPSTINFDLKTGKKVTLAELFESNSAHLVNIAEESKKILKRTCLMCPCKNGISAGDTLPEDLIKEADSINRNSTNANSQINYQDALFFERGTEPKEENYKNWSLTAEGLKITFGEYQVGPGCIGTIKIVIPYNVLQPLLRKDLSFN